jgi:uncharacterized protein (DUF58 family)
MRVTRLTLILLAVGIVPLFFSGVFPGVRDIVLAYDGVLIGLCVLDWIITPKSRNFRLVRQAEESFSLGEPNPVSIELTAPPSFATRLEIRDEYPAGFRTDRETCTMTARPGVRGVVRYRLTPPRRGEFRFGAIHFRYLGKLRLIYRAGKLPQPQQVRVYPNLVELRRYDLWRRRSHLQASGVRTIRRRGEGSEFESLREYVPDDDIRWINWKATAKHQFPITQNFQPEKNQTVILLLDVGRRMTTEVEGMSKLDYAVSAALLLGYVANDMGDQVGLMLFGGESETYLPPGRGKRQVQRLLDSLYAARADLSEPDYPAVMARLAERFKRRALVIVFTDVTDEHTSRSLVDGLRLLRPRHLPLVVAIADRSLHRRTEKPVKTKEDVYQKAVAVALLGEREKVVRSMLHAGAHVLDRLPEEISPETVNAYLEIKRRRLL